MSKFEKVNVSEKLYQTFLVDSAFMGQMPALQNSSVLQKIHNATSTNRGRGQTRVITNLTEQEWEDLYYLAVAARNTILRNGRKNVPHLAWEDVLSAGICARTLTDRMEKAGVANPVPYTSRKSKTEDVSQPDTVDETGEDGEDTNLDSQVPTEPLSMERADEDEADEETQEAFRTDFQSNIG